MVEPGNVTAIKATAGKASNFFWDWGVPMLAMGVGYVVGDYFSLGDKIKSLDKGGYVTKAATFISNPYDCIGAFLYFGIGTGIWKMIGGGIGKILGMAAIGMGLNSLFKVFA